MRLMMLSKLMLATIVVSLLAFGLLQDFTFTAMLKAMALGAALSIGATVMYPEIRGIKAGDSVSVVQSSSIPSIIGRAGRAVADGRKNGQIKIVLDNGVEVMGVVESYTGLISPPKIRIIYEEKLVE